MPEAWSPSSMGSPGYGEAFYDDSITERSRDSVGDDFGDESKLFRSASIGKKTKASLVDNPPVPASISQSRPAPKPAQMTFRGTGYTEESGGSSNTLPPGRQMPETSTGIRNNQFLAPMGMGTGPDTSGEDRRPSPQPPPSRLSTMRRPPKLDIAAVRAAEARGSMTSLPDLIKRATRLAAMIEKGKRPASRFDNLNDLLANAPNGDKEDTCKLQSLIDSEVRLMLTSSAADDRHQSGLSDMLAAFPPPAQLTPNARQSGGSWFRTTSWPLAPSRLGEVENEAPTRGPADGTTSGDDNVKPARRCCGMPPWLFVLVIVLILCAIAAAIVVPLQFFVFKTLGNHEEPQSAFDKCQEDLSCRNGGTNVISQGVCSCICTNGFTGRDCSVGGSEGCTTTNLVSSDPSSTIEDVTLGKAIPRLIADANSNFSIPLSGTRILAKINNGDISCRAQNSLVTFDGRPMRIGQAKADIVDVVDGVAANAAGAPIETLTVTAGTRATLTIPDDDNLVGLPTEGRESSNPTGDATATNEKPKPRSTDSSADTNPTSSSDDDLAGNFTVTEEVLDFSRVAVLYILQEESLDDAETAQSSLQQFFSRARRTGDGFKPATEKEAQKIIVGGDNSVNLVDFSVDIGDGPIGRSHSKRSVFVTCSDESSGS
ncbi:hypothetical protein ACRE_021940 [Hapsidospora chrysogenum ATCC 11550]|uniref:EGF-like domain-containing protein n=1 Tax=Hapsidospora chrysogenum (strain ATCC 11550 / CBS 779.69 / DSM 880 / IAM 14645 / JCM 23072 / IMI 49137) TaxID=857340 RepID=A0A086TC57_HAPC1|nr:hypothetical protein ACRE_021940 [Hapsidospora chrysogenum ATCC 11550]